MSIISFSHVTFSYPTTDVLTNVSFTCGTDERLCVVGPNGSGKTTLLKLALGELTPLRGHVDTPLSATSLPLMFQQKLPAALMNYLPALQP